MCTLPLLAGENISARFVVPTVAASVDLVVHLGIDLEGVRRVNEIVAVPGRVENDIIETETVFERCRAERGASGCMARRMASFQRLGIEVEPVMIDNPSALQKLRSGEVSALVRAVGKPVDFFTKIPANSGFHFVPIPFSKLFADYYSLGELTSKDYPTLVPDGDTVDTIAVPAVLAVYNWQKGNDRYRRVERFIDNLFGKWSQFQQPPRHPKWRDINLAATVPGWTRFSVADQMLAKVAGRPSADPQDLSRDFQAFLTQSDQPAPRSQSERDALFREFLMWRDKQGARRQQ
jgi:hypothetical protein